MFIRTGKNWLLSLLLMVEVEVIRSVAFTHPMLFPSWASASTCTAQNVEALTGCQRTIKIGAMYNDYRLSRMHVSYAKVNHMHSRRMTVRYFGMKIVFPSSSGTISEIHGMLLMFSFPKWLNSLSLLLLLCCFFVVVLSSQIIHNLCLQSLFSYPQPCIGNYISD